MCEYVRVNARKNPGLTPDDLDTLAAGLAAGKRVTVYLRDPMPSLDLDAGTSARVVSIDGTTVTVSPKGIDDQLPFEADELRKSRGATTAESSTRRRAPATTANAIPRPAGHAPAAPRVTEPKAEAKQAPVKAVRRTKTPTAAVSVTITSSGTSNWTVSVAHGTKKQGKAAEVNADRVARAMRELGDENAIAAVDGVIESARAAAQKRVDELSKELESARAALADLDG